MLPGVLSSKENLPAVQETRRRCKFDPWVGKILWCRKWQLASVFLGFPSSSDGEKSACNARDPGSISELGRSPREGNSRSLAWNIPWTEEPGGQSTGS